jgi:hypothetical protein
MTSFNNFYLTFSINLPIPVSTKSAPLPQNHKYQMLKAPGRTIQELIEFPTTPRIIVVLRISPRFELIPRTAVLMNEFPWLRANTLSRAFTRCNRLYAPTYIHLHESGLAQNPEARLRKRRQPKPVDLTTSAAGGEVFAEVSYIESWLEEKDVQKQRKLREEQEKADAETARRLNFEEHEGRGGLIEWCELSGSCAYFSGCCFDQYPANIMTSCMEGHLFCLDCAKTNAETTVGSGKFVRKIGFCLI